MFYQEWFKAKYDKKDCKMFIESFLNASDESLNVLYSGNDNDVIFAIKLLLATPMEEFISAINCDALFSSKDIFQYSSFDDAVNALCNILYHECETLTYFEAGQKLTRTSKKFACTKYGENHIKLAEAFSFVVINKPLPREPKQAKITTLGRISIRLSPKDKNELIRRLAIRNPFLKSLIYNAKNDIISYSDLASRALSGQTINRRKHNVEIVANLVLRDHSIKNNIRW